MSTFTVNTLHRGRVILILLGTLFTVAILTSSLDVKEAIKIVVLLLSLPLLLYISIRFTRDTSVWTIDEHQIQITKDKKNYQIDLNQISHIRNHIRSGGNLISIHKNNKKSPLRFWRNKLYQSNDDFDDCVQYLKSLSIPIIIG